MRVIHVTNELPYPMDRGAPVRSYQLLRWLGQEFEIDVLALTEKSGDALTEAKAAVNTVCRSVRTFPSHEVSALGRPLKAINYAVRGIPIDLRGYASRPLMDALWHEARRGTDVIAIEHAGMMAYLDAIPPAQRARTVGLSHDVDFAKFARLAEVEPSLARKMRLRLHGRMMRRWEPRSAARCGRYTTVSETDRQRLLRADPRIKATVVPNGVDVDRYRPLPPPARKSGILFLGNLSYRPNIDAVTWLVEGILPRVWEAGVQAALDVVGVNPTLETERLASDRVRVVGPVADVLSSYQAAQISVVPLRAGGGTRLKILEAMALGRPVVSTTIGCEGLEVETGVHLLIADTEQEFAAAVVELLGDEARRTQLARNARELVERRYDWRNIAGELANVYREVANTAGMVGVQGMAAGTP